MKRPAAVLLLLLALLAAGIPVASAHAEPYSNAQTFGMGTYQVYLDTDPSPIYAKSAVTFRAYVSDTRTGSLETDASLKLTLSGPNGTTVQVNLAFGQSGYLEAKGQLPLRGNYTTHVELTTKNESRTATTWFLAYPALPFRIYPGYDMSDPVLGQPYTITFEVRNVTTLRLEDRLTDLEVRLEHWTDDHSRMLGATNVTLSRAQTGIWQGQATVNQAGMYHLRVRSTSGGFGFEDQPVFHTYTSTPYSPPGTTDTRGSTTPMPVTALFLAAAIAVWRRQRAG